MPDVLRDAFASKKFLVFFASAIVAIGNKVASHFGYELDPDTVTQLVALAGAYIVGQGIADHGKEAKRVEVDAQFGERARAFGIAQSQAGRARLGLLVAIAVGAAALLGPSACSTPAVKNVETNVIDCSKAELAIATSGTSVIAVAIDTAAAIAAAAAGGGLDAALVAIKALIVRYGEPIVACAVVKGASQPARTVAGGAGRTNMMDLVFDTHTSLARQVAQHYGWRVSL